MLTETLLRKAINIDLNLQHVDSLYSALDLAEKFYFDAIILDLNLPDATGVEGVRKLHCKFPEKAIVVITGTDDDSLAQQAMLLGAQDYLIKGDYTGDAIWRSLRHAIERKRFERRLEAMAKFDALTGLVNRNHCLDRIRCLLDSLQRYGGTAAVLFVDLDKFKWINDNLGHEKGDELLVVIAERLKKSVRLSDTVARMGGDEFVIVLERVQNPQYAAKVAEKLIEICNLPIRIDAQDVYVGASIGIAMCADDCLEPSLLLKHADLAMYRAKECGRNNFQFFTPELNVYAKGRAILANSLHEAIESGELELYYQPKVKVCNNALCGAEVLLRWNHSDSGLILPDVFIPLLEETGLIISVGQWVLETATKQFQSWHERGLISSTDKIAANLSARQFVFTDLTATIAQTLDDSSLPPHMLELELTESILLQDTEQSKKVLTSLRELGVHIAIDDLVQAILAYQI